MNSNFLDFLNKEKNFNFYANTAVKINPLLIDSFSGLFLHHLFTQAQA